MRFPKPFTGQVLIEILPDPTVSAGGLSFPGPLTLSADMVQEQAKDPQKPTDNQVGIVRRMGGWPRLRNGMAKMPEFGLGQKVVINRFRGEYLHDGYQKFKLLDQSDVMAVLT